MPPHSLHSSHLTRDCHTAGQLHPTKQVSGFGASLKTNKQELKSSISQLCSDDPPPRTIAHYKAMRGFLWELVSSFFHPSARYLTAGLVKVTSLGVLSYELGFSQPAMIDCVCLCDHSTGVQSNPSSAQGRCGNITTVGERSKINPKS